MFISLAVAVVLSQSGVKKVEIIRGHTTKKAATETSVNVQNSGPTPEQQARESQLEAKSVELNARADELKSKDAANEAKKDSDAKTQAAQQKILEKHSHDMQKEYENAANALAGQE